ncbi:MAG: hypothetical protein HGA85_00805 [Nanoarchaeota archaeon]|nr:hypothetical protein [Nanoarchaeota archaeon]
MGFANKITYARIMLAALLLVLAGIGDRLWFVILFCISAILDIADGTVARKEGPTSFGAKLDVIADEITTAAAFLGLYLLKQSLFLRYMVPFLSIIALFAFLQVSSYAASKKYLFARTKPALLAAIAFPIMIVVLVFYDSLALVYAYTLLMYVSLLDKASKLYSCKVNYLFLTAIAALAAFAVISYGAREIVCIDTSCLEVEIMRSPEERAIGLMYRDGLEKEKGMLFEFQNPEKPNFWMMNMRFPIDIIFINGSGKVVSVFNSVPPCSREPCQFYAPEEDVLWVLETASGYAKSRSITVGSAFSR